MLTRGESGNFYDEPLLTVFSNGNYIPREKFLEYKRFCEKHDVPFGYDPTPTGVVDNGAGSEVRWSGICELRLSIKAEPTKDPATGKTVLAFRCAGHFKFCILLGADYGTSCLATLCIGEVFLKLSVKTCKDYFHLQGEPYIITCFTVLVNS